MFYSFNIDVLDFMPSLTKGKTVTVEHDPASAPQDKIKLEIEDQGYEVVS